MYHIAICDDSKEYILYIEGILNEIKEERNIDMMIYEYISGERLVYNLEKGIQYNLLILDMELGGIDGDETARIFREKYPYAVLVFCSGVRQPTIESFKTTPFRYLLKQQKRKELVEIIKEILDEVEKTSNKPFIMSHYRWETKKIDLNSILYIENSKRGGKIIIYPKCEEKFLVDKKPEELLTELQEFGFALAQGSYLVNMNHIQVMRVDDFVFESGEVLKISRAYQKSFKEAFIKYFSNKYI